ncbi:DUF3438 family protein [Salmonella enterica]|uniref:TIGR03749 family integrating conjugative element protein n=1 Tax=Salmonella enterica I TaxID=59201 RepID=A0A8F6T1L1_SALET|nr:DUF3438 family protein [Salmonella enterica]PUO36853.1 hypothetical protein DAY10_25835 [Salmonella enterica subsp. enterica]PUO62553.1 hypothetical protein DAX55_19575 [Salmonella enterica subsp. enterica]PUQ10937.1 hypothetical protein DAX99_25075 [Salmonella enterica subsp. enterica]QXR78181.1 TIGR03749 family integrating conjugative element protein [Salmonella enterica subsp. enterica]
MATLKFNALVKVLVPAVLLGAAGIGLYVCMSGSLDKMAVPWAAPPPLTPEQLREPGIAGDTLQDTQAISDPSDILARGRYMARGRYNVEILVIRNNREGYVVVDPQVLSGKFVVATFRHRWVRASGQPEDITILYLMKPEHPEAAFAAEPPLPVTTGGKR